VTVPGRFAKIAAWVLMGLLAVGAGLVELKRRRYEDELLQLRNRAASLESTIEIKKGIWAKASLEVDGLKKLLDVAQKHNAGLKEELEKSKSEVLGLTQVSVKLRKDYEALLAAKQTEVPGKDGEPGRTKVEFEKEFGPYRVSGHTLTNPGEAQLRLSQHRPLRLSVALAQNPDKSWRTYVASSEDDLQIDVQIAAVNPYLFSRKWYENIELFLQGAGASSSAGAGAIGGIGIGYRIGRFSVGPGVWAGFVGGRTFHAYGVHLGWRPFERK
jgi:hypothetical protein